MGELPSIRAARRVWPSERAADRPAGRRQAKGGSGMATQDGQRVVVVTGASGGVGRATARRFAAAGDAVGLLARGADGLAGAAEDVRAAGGVPLPLVVDVADDGAVDAA